MQADPGLNVSPSTAGSIPRFFTQTESVLGLLSSLVPGRYMPRRWYGECGNGQKNPKNPSPPESPPGKVRFRECPPPPKLPKLPKCPPPCPPPPPPPVPKCPEPPKCPPPCPPPQKTPSPPNPLPKQKCSGRNTSAHGLIQCLYKHAVTADGSMPLKSLVQRSPVSQLSHRRISTSAVIFGSKCNKKGKDTSNKCPTKKSAANCAKPTKRRAKPSADCRKPKQAENCTSGCAPKPRCPPPPPPPPKKSRVQWSPPICSPPKLVGPSPCPETTKKAPGLSDAKSACPPPPPLPKPPCRPVCLCPCPPPPKLPPGSCPEVPTADESNQPSCLPPCPPKQPLPCPTDTWCPSKPSCPSKK